MWSDANRLHFVEPGEVEDEEGSINETVALTDDGPDVCVEGTPEEFLALAARIVERFT